MTNVLYAEDPYGSLIEPGAVFSIGQCHVAVKQFNPNRTVVVTDLDDDTDWTIPPGMVQIEVVFVRVLACSENDGTVTVAAVVNGQVHMLVVPPGDRTAEDHTIQLVPPDGHRRYYATVEVAAGTPSHFETSHRNIARAMLSLCPTDPDQMDPTCPESLWREVWRRYSPDERAACIARWEADGYQHCPHPSCPPGLCAG